MSAASADDADKPITERTTTSSDTHSAEADTQTSAPAPTEPATSSASTGSWWSILDTVKSHSLQATTQLRSNATTLLQTAKADIEDFQKSLSAENQQLLEQARRKAERVKREVEDRLKLQQEQQAESNVAETTEDAANSSSASAAANRNASSTKKPSGVGTVAAQSVNSLTERLDLLGGSVLDSTSKYLSALHSAVDSLSHHNQSKQPQLPDVEAPIVANPLIRMQYDKRSYLTDPQPTAEYQTFAKQFERDFEAVWEPQINTIEDDGVLAMYERLVPAQVDEVTFFARYFWLLQKIKTEDERRANVLSMLQKQRQSGEMQGGHVNDEELNWDVDLSPEDQKVAEEPHSAAAEVKTDVASDAEVTPTTDSTAEPATADVNKAIASVDTVSEQLASAALSPAAAEETEHSEKADESAPAATQQKTARAKSPVSDPNSLTTSPVEVSQNDGDSDVWEWE